MYFAGFYSRIFENKDTNGQLLIVSTAQKRFRLHKFVSFKYSEKTRRTFEQKSAKNAKY